MLSDHVAPVLGVAFSPDGKRLATVSVDTTARVWDAVTGKLLGVSYGRPGHVAPVTGIAFSPDGKRLATASADKTAKVWEAESGVELFSLPSHVAIGINVGLNKSHLITATRDRKVVRIWDTTTKQSLPPLLGLNGQPIYTDRDIAAALSPDGSHLATANEDGTTKVWDASTGKRLYTLEGHTAPVMTAAFSQDGNRLATGSADKTARVWDTKSGKQLFDLSDHEGPVIAIAFSPDQSSSRLVTASEDEEKGTIRIWDSSTGEQRRSIPHQGGPILAVALSADGTRLATASADTMVRIVDVTTTQLLYTLPGHGGPIRAIAFNADATHLIAASVEGAVRTYPLKIDNLVTTALKYLCERPMPVHEHMDRQLKGRYLDLCPHYP
jgi:WD40 repeat protein